MKEPDGIWFGDPFAYIIILSEVMGIASEE
jgi:hypothetical protein